MNPAATLLVLLVFYFIKKGLHSHLQYLISTWYQLDLKSTKILLVTTLLKKCYINEIKWNWTELTQDLQHTSFMSLRWCQSAGLTTKHKNEQGKVLASSDLPAGAPGCNYLWSRTRMTRCKYTLEEITLPLLDTGQRTDVNSVAKHVSVTETGWTWWHCYTVKSYCHEKMSIIQLFYCNLV